MSVVVNRTVAPITLKGFDARCIYTFRLADTSLVLAQRLGQWVGHAPALEEDLGLANLALDLLGQARMLLSSIGQADRRGFTEDDLAYWRGPEDYLNIQLVEQPNLDFAHTIVRQFLVDAYQFEQYTLLANSSDKALSAIAKKALPEKRYHLRYSKGWLVRLGDGTAESHARTQSALDCLWRYTGELLSTDDIEHEMHARGVGPDPARLVTHLRERVYADLEDAMLVRPVDIPYQWQGKQGRHSEHLSYLLGEMQFMQRSFPGLQW